VETITINPTSSDSAKCSPVVLRQTGTTRLVFKPELVNNQQDGAKPLKGVLVHQRKKSADEWEDIESINLATLKAGEGVKLDLNCDELDRLLGADGLLYDLHKLGRIPRWTTVVKAADRPGAVSFTPEMVETAVETLGTAHFGRVVRWATESSNTVQLIDQLERLDIKTLQQLNAAVGVSTLKAALDLWRRNQGNADEEFWQRSLQEQAFVLAQAFSFPLMILKGKAYVGGKGVENSGANLLDYLCRLQLTPNVVLIEIKTPATTLLGREYRGGIYNVDTELSGAVMQVTDYKDSLLKEHAHLQRNSSARYEAFNPQCLVVAGNTTEFAGDADRVKSFELFRNGLKDVTVITYDELFRKVANMVERLESGQSGGG
jgi:hypothetical protein